MKGKYRLLGSTGLNMSTRPMLQAPQARSPSARRFELSPPLNKLERGGILGRAAEIQQAGDGFSTSTRANDEGVIKLALLLVDKIDKPRSSIMNFGMEDHPDITHIGAGAQSIVIENEILTYEQASELVWDTYCQLEMREPGRWSVWQQYDNPVIPAKFLSPEMAFQLELVSGLIVPSPTTPYEDVLSFKQRHLDELLSLRHHLERLAIKLSNEGDPRAVHLEREQFDVSLSDYLKKARQSNVRKAVASLTTELDWATAIRSMVAGGTSTGLIAATQSLSIPHAAAAIGSGILAGLSLKSVAGLSQTTSSPFRYIARIEREFKG